MTCWVTIKAAAMLERMMIFIILATNVHNTVISKFQSGLVPVCIEHEITINSESLFVEVWGLTPGCHLLGTAL